MAVLAVLFNTLLPPLLLAQVSHNMVAIHGNVAPEAQKLTALRSADAQKRLNLEIQFVPRDQAAVNKLLAAQQDPTSAEYHKWITPKEYTQRFGPTPAEYNAVAKWIESQGFTVTGGSRGASNLRFTGTVAQAQNAFQTQIFNYKDNEHFANAVEPKIPAQFQPIIGEVTGLHNLGSLTPMLKPKNLIRSRVPLHLSSSGLSPQFNLGLVGFQGLTFAPPDFYTFYDENSVLSSNTGAPPNDCIGIFDATNIYPDILQVFTSNPQALGYSMPPVQFSADTSSEGDPGVVFPYDGEAYLDIEWAHTTAPGDPIILYVGNPYSFTAEQSLADVLTTAVVQNRCGAISISYGTCNQPATFYTQTMGSIFTQAALQGQSVFVSAGDSGVDTCDLGTPNINELSANPLVTSVGGTMFDAQFDNQGNNVGFVPEAAWNQVTPQTAGQNETTGGGQSQVFSKPSYQSGPGVPADGVRDIPDIAMIAGLPAVLIVMDQDNADGTTSDVVTPNVMVGTSLSAPLWAGISRLLSQAVNARLGPINPGIYFLANNGYASNGFRDVLNGTNSYINAQGQTEQGYNAGPGFDLVSGWGTVDIANFLQAWTIASGH
jgi:subtilase family serine protease